LFLPSITGCPGCIGHEPTTAGPPAACADAVASLAVQELMGIICGDNVGAEAFNCVEYDPETQAIERKYVSRADSCPLCGSNGILGAGDARRQKR
jgi:hypothetical protein